MDENEEGSSISMTKENTDSDQEPMSVKNVTDEIDQIDIQEKPCTDTKENECLTDFISDDKTASVSSDLEEKDKSEQDCDKSLTPNDEKPHTLDSNKNLDNNIVLATQTEASNKTHSDESAVETIEATDLKSIDTADADAERAAAHTSNAASVPIGKTVGLADTEEGELDYEEEEIAVTVDQQADHEEGEIMDDKDIEGSEEGEIVSDNEGEQTSTNKDGHEEGEINDYDLEEGQLDEAVERGHRPRTLCKYYDAGTCRWGVSCRFLHPGINDKGNYLMHRPPGMYPTAFGKPPPPNEMGPLNPILPRSTVLHAPGFIDNVPLPVDLERPPAGPKKESAWERGLKKAKEIKLTSQKRREEDEQFEEKRMNLSIKETQKEPDRPSPTIRRDQWRPGYERESQNEKFTPRSRPADYRQETNERRFNRNRKSPPKRYEQERERNNKGHEFERDKPRDMDRERFLRLQRRRSPTPPERRHERERNRERERDKPDARRDRRIDTRTDPQAERGKENYIEDVERNEKPQVSVEETNKPTEPVKEEQIAAPVAKTLEAEQWRDPWMRTQSQPIKSPERISPLQRSPIAEDIVSGDSSGTDSESDSDDSEESGSESGSESKESSDAEEEAEKIEEVAKPPPVTAASKEPQVSSPQGALPKDPRLKERSSKDSTPKRDSPQLAKESNRSTEKGYHQRSHRDPRDYDKRRRPDEPQRRGRDRSAERERRHRDRTDGPSQNANSFPQWRGPHHVDSGWQRGGYNQFMQNNYRGMPDRRTESRRHEDDPRLIQGDRARGRRRSRSKSPRSAPYPRKNSSLRDPRRGATDHGASTDKDRKQPNQDRRGPSPSSRNYSPQQKDPRLPYANSSKRREEDKKTKDVAKNDRNAEPKEKREIKPEAVVEEAKKPETKPATAHSDVSEDEFESPKYGDSGSGSDSDSDTGSESGSDSEAGSELASASPSGSANEASNSESEGNDSASNSDKLSASSHDEVSNSKKKELEKKKKDFKMVLSMAKTSASSSKGSKAQNTPKGSITTKSVKDHSDRSDPRLQIGQKRSMSDHSSSNASPKGGSSKTAARKNELLKELKAIEDAIARKRAKID